MSKQSFRTRLAEAEPVFGIFAKTNDPFFIEALGRTGFDFVILDNEHGPNDIRDLYPLILAAENSGLYPVVRVGELAALEIQRVLDLGPAGVQVPQVQSRADARRVAEYSKFHPVGARGVCRFVRAAEFSRRDRDRYFAAANETVVVIHIEGTAAVAAFDEIVAEPALDVIFIGPYDLSQSLGLPGQVDHPRVLAEIENLVARGAACGKAIGIFADTPEAARRYKHMGVKYIAYNVDVGVFVDACAALVQQLRSL